MTKETKLKTGGSSALVLGILGLLICLMPYFAIVLSITAVVISNKYETGLANAGRILGIIGCAINGIMLLFFFVSLYFAFVVA